MISANISNQLNINLLFTIDPKPHNATKLFIDKYDEKKNNTINLFASKYSLLYKSTGDVVDQPQIKKFAEIINKTYVSGLIYKSLSSTFVSDYFFCVDNHKYLVDCKNILIFRDNINIDESLLHFYEKNNVSDVKVNIYPVFLRNIPSYKKFEESSKSLLSRYPNSNILYHDTLNEPPFVKNHMRLSDNYKDQKLDLIVCDFRLSKSKILDLYYFVSVLITIDVLDDGGTYVFRIHKNSYTYILQICTFLSKYFKTIFLSRQKIRPYESSYIFCIDFKKSTNINISLPLNDDVSNFFSFQNGDPKIKINLDTIRDHINASIAKKERTFDSKIKYAEKLSLDEMMKHHSYNNKMNLHRSILIARKYDLKLQPHINFKIKKMNFTFDAPINIIFLQTSDKRTEINTLSDQSAKLQLYKSGIDSVDQAKWQSLIHKMNIARLIPEKMNKSEYQCKIYEVRHVYKIANNFNVYDIIDEDIVQHISLAIKAGDTVVLKLKIPFTNITWLSLLSEHFQHVAFYKTLVGSLIDDDVFIILKNKSTKMINFDTYRPKIDFLNNLEYVSNTIIDLQILKLRILFDAYNDAYVDVDIEKYAHEYYLQWYEYFDIKSFANIDT